MGKNQPFCLLLFSLPLPIPMFHLKLRAGTLSNHSVPSACMFTALLSLERVLGREAPGASGEGHLLFPSLTFSSGLGFEMALSWTNSPSAPILLAHAF